MQFNKLTARVLFHVCHELTAHELKHVMEIVPEGFRGSVDCLVDLAQCMHDLGTQKALTSAQIGFLVERWDAMEGDAHTQVYLDSLYADSQTEEQKGLERFEDSAEATEFFDQLQKMLDDPRARQWIKATDYNYGTSTLADFLQAGRVITNVINNLEDCN